MFHFYSITRANLYKPNKKYLEMYLKLSSLFIPENKKLVFIHRKNFAYIEKYLSCTFCTKRAL